MKESPVWRLAAVVAVLAMSWGVPQANGQAPLHERIDAAVESPPVPPLAPLCSDSEFVRRVYLDLVGTVPPVTATRAFLADSDSGKRVALVDRLLASPQHSRHLATTFDVMLMERRPDGQVKSAEWQQYLYDSFAANKPWDQLAREILTADGTDEKIRPAARFYLDRNGEPNLLTRDIGRMFFGMDLACCQCHDHPLVDSYRQAHYYGMYAFVSRGTMFTDKEKKVFFAERAEGDVKFTSVFTKEQDETRPCLPGGFEIEEPVFLKGQEYVTAPADGVRPVPKFSRRAVLAESATSGTNQAFNRNIVNRLWTLMMGRGLVEPLDMHHADNPPTHPELLDLLADEFARMKFDIRGMLRELALTRVYQRALEPPTELAPVLLAAGEQLPGLVAAEQQAASVATSIREEMAGSDKAYDAARKNVTAVLGELTTANNALGSAQKASGEAAKAQGEAEQQLATKRDLAATLATAAAKAAEAAAKLTGDEELAQATAKFKGRADQFAGEIPALEKAVAERVAAAKTAADALGAATTAGEQLVAKLAGVNQVLAQARQTLADAQQKRQAAELAWFTAQVRRDRAQALADLKAVALAAESSRQRNDALRAEIAAGKQQLASLVPQLPQLEAALNAARSAKEAADKLLQDTQSQLAARQQTAQAIADAVTSAEAALQKLPQDNELKQATELVKSRRDKLLAEVAEMQKGMEPLQQSAKTMGDQFAAAQQAYASSQMQVEILNKTVPEKEALLPGVQSQAEAEEQAYQVALREAAARWGRDFSLSRLVPLTPEQMASSILTVTGVVDQQRAAAEAEVNKTLPLDANAPPDPARIAQRERQIEQQMYEKLKGNVAAFVGLFGHAAGQPQRDFFATVDQALYFANAGVLQSWLNPSGENLLGRLVKLNEPQQVAEELYISVLMRTPSSAEVEAVANHLQSRQDDRPVALQELAWGLITSNEFRFRY